MVERKTVSNSSLDSTFSVVKIPRDKKSHEYDPFEHRQVSHPTTDSETLFHLLKGSLGSGILSMPLAFSNSGLWFGLISTIIVGSICTYCVHILVKCSYILCRRAQLPSLSFAEIVELAFSSGPKPCRKWSSFARFLVNTFLVLDLLGCCVVYTSFVAKNVHQVVENYYPDFKMSLKLYMLCLLPILIPINLIRNLKNLAPLSVIANILIMTGVGITMYYIFQDLPTPNERPFIAEWNKVPMFFGTVIFALEGIGVVMPLYNNMKTPSSFLGCPGVLNIGMTIVVLMYAGIGFLGYLKYGEHTEPFITLNLPVTEKLAQSVKLSIAIAILFTYALQFYVPMEIIWNSVRSSFSESKQTIVENILRTVIVIGTVLIAISIPNIGPFISLVGAVCLSTLGLIIPSVIELIIYYYEPGYGKFNYVLWKNAFLIVFGLIGFILGSYISLLEIIESLRYKEL
ncbi:proton-coupled amino acid transporter-like protein pathetic [Contarinia nasturtii]|uniref:proton-coupled amino acid transporter-like protein pathetic n=1 Tax=Contarinia nasturtii TaxID=265458 RepID=UPI0012D46C5A|nr:proton-coupled amino acid transporter-like protein pathetic [Contarinia nasturtii]